MNNKVQEIKNRIALLKTRDSDNGAIVKKLERKIRSLQKDAE